MHASRTPLFEMPIVESRITVAGHETCHKSAAWRTSGRHAALLSCRTHEHLAFVEGHDGSVRAVFPSTQTEVSAVAASQHLEET